MGAVVSSSPIFRVLRERNPSPAPPWAPSQRRELLMNFSSLSPVQGQQFSTNCSNAGHSCAGCSPSRTGWGHKSHQDTCSSVAVLSMLCRSLPGASPALAWVSSVGCRWIPVALSSTTSMLEPTGICSLGHEEASSNLSQNPPLLPLLLPKPSHADPIQTLRGITTINKMLKILTGKCKFYLNVFIAVSNY